MTIPQLKKLVEDFSVRKQSITALTLVAIASLVKKGHKIWGINDITNEIIKIREKIKLDPFLYSDIIEKEVTPMSVVKPLATLCDMVVIRKVQDNPAKYELSIKEHELYRYAGEILLLLLR